jgi:hypothetical protein
MFLQEGLEHCLGGFSIVDIPRAVVWGHVIKIYLKKVIFSMST